MSLKSLIFDNLIKAGEIYQNKISGRYTFYCVCCFDGFDSFHNMLEHIEEQQFKTDLILNNKGRDAADNPFNMNSAIINLHIVANGKSDEAAATEYAANPSMIEYESNLLNLSDFYETEEDANDVKPAVMQTIHMNIEQVCESIVKESIEISDTNDNCESLENGSTIHESFIEQINYGTKDTINGNNKPKGKEKIVTSYTAEAPRLQLHNEKTFECNKCLKKFSQNSQLKNHLVEHNNLFICDLCDKALTSKSNLKVHMKCHFNIKSHKCDICHKGFSLASYLKEHKVIHTGTKPYECSVCGLCFYAKRKLKTHVNRKHILSKQHKCGTCDMKFFTEYLRRKHEHLHTDFRPYTCKVCDKSFKAMSTLRTHSYLHKGKSLKCKFCELTFSQNSGRRWHEKCKH